FRIRMSRNFGMKMLTMTNLSTECLIQLTKLGYDATPFNQILKQNAKREMRLRLGKVTVADVLAAQPVKPFFVPFGAVVYSVINIKLGEHIVALCQFIHELLRNRYKLITNVRSSLMPGNIHINSR